ncbi:MAG: diacylglycerol/lipid kinase family protein [Candidatus Faecivicinus sp.]
MKNLLLVLNPCAGQRKANRVLPEIIRIFLDAGYRCEVFVTAAGGDATRYVAERAAQFERVVCIGGDGTLNETIAGLKQANVDLPIGYIPAGTTNDYANSLGLSSDVLKAAHDAVEGQICRLDVGRFNGRYFTYTASCGAFTKASYSTPQSMKNSLGHLAYVLEGVKELATLRPFHLRVETSESVLEDDFLFCSITNSTSVGGILKLDAEMVALNDGRFEVMLVRNPTTPMQLSTILHALTALDLPNEMVHFFSADRISVECAAPIEWTLDGEREEGAPRVEMENLHSAVQIVVPQTEGEKSEDAE